MTNAAKVLWLAQLLISAAVSPANAEKRVALIIGNGAYMASPLANPANDARAIAKSLDSLGFKTTILIDANKTTHLTRAIQRWGLMPLMLFNHLDLKSLRYGYIGTGDYMMYPLLQPGALVVLDESKKRIVSGSTMTISLICFV